MQELESVPGLAGRLFGGGAAANVNGNGILRRHGPSAARQEASAADEVRCPRCDSANTKFCYYNNYNLAQPRHFCRACRRYWTKGGHLRNVPVGGGCRKPKPRRHAPAADGVHAAGRDGKAPRSGCAGLATDGDAPVPSAFSAAAVTEPSGTISGSRAEATAGARTLAAGDARAPLVPPPAPMFADQAPVFASLFAPPRPLPAFISCSAQPKAGERVASLLAMQQSPSSAADAAGTAAPSCAGAPDWPTAASDAAGVFELAGGIAGDASWTAYWNPAGSWTDADPTIYLP